MVKMKNDLYINYRKSTLFFSGTDPAQKKIFVVRYRVLFTFSEQNLKKLLIISHILRPVLSWDKLILDDFLGFFLLIYAHDPKFEKFDLTLRINKICLSVKLKCFLK